MQPFFVIFTLTKYKKLYNINTKIKTKEGEKTNE